MPNPAFLLDIFPRSGVSLSHPGERILSEKVGTDISVTSGYVLLCTVCAYERMNL